MDRSLLKANARNQLGGSLFANNWLTGLVICLIYTAIPSAVAGLCSSFGSFRIMFNVNSFSDMIMNAGGMDMTSPEGILEFYKMIFTSMGPSYVIIFGATFLISILVTPPLTYGLSKSFLDLVMGGEKLNIETLFSGFKKYGETVLLGFMISLFTSLWSLLFIIPGIIKWYAYSMSYYVKADHPEYTWQQCMKESERLMKGYKFSYFVLQLSFIGWMLLGAMVCGIGTLWVAPYEQCTYANFYAWRTAGAAPDMPVTPEAPFTPPQDCAPAGDAVQAPVQEAASDFARAAEAAEESAAPAADAAQDAAAFVTETIEETTDFVTETAEETAEATAEDLPDPFTEG